MGRGKQGLSYICTQRSNLFCLAIVLLACLAAHIFSQHAAYVMTPAEKHLLSKTSVDLNKVTYKDGKLTFNQTTTTPGAQKLTVSTLTNSTSPDAYRVTMASKASDGIEFSDATNNLPFKLVPMSQTGAGKFIDGRMVYPLDGAQGVYTLRRNGIKEDIIIPQYVSDNFSYRWKLELGDKLTAKMMDNGSIGIYSADPVLFNQNLQISDAKSQSLINKARQSGQKDNLQYIIPAPYFKDDKGKMSTKGVSFSLDGSVLTLNASGLKNKSYPLSIDPTIVTTTTAQFQLGYDDGNIDYSTADEIDRGNVSYGGANSWNFTSLSANNGTTFSTGFTTTREDLGAVVYNNHIYVLGGKSAAGTSECLTGYCNGVQFASISSSTGTVGSWHYTHNSLDDGSGTYVNGFIEPRSGFSVVAYNGFMYILGGVNSGIVSNDCSITCNGVQYAPINTNGTLGAWHFTHNGTDDGTSFVSGFTRARDGQSTVIYNGYMYLLGGHSGTTGDDCSTYCNGVQYAKINANGTLGAWHYTHNNTDDSTSFVSGFTAPRGYQDAVAYNGFLYVLGGFNSTNANDCTTTNGTVFFCNGVQFAKINSDGTIGSWSYTASGSSSASFSSGFTTARQDASAVASGGFMYITGGASASQTIGCANNNICTDVQFARINANGTIGTWAYTSSIVGGMYGHSSLVYGGYIYVIGGHGTQTVPSDGCDTNSQCNGVEYAQLITPSTAEGSLSMGYPCSPSTQFCTASTFTNPRDSSAVVAYNGYIYIVGGENYAGSTAYNDVQFAQILSNGTLGNFSSAGTFTNARFGAAAVAYNGFFYIIGGDSTSATGNCTAGFCNDIQISTINSSNGTLGVFTLASTFTNARYFAAATTYNGYLYIAGGFGSCGTVCSDVQYAAINISTGALSQPAAGGAPCVSNVCTAGSMDNRWQLGATAYNGYLYLAGGNYDNVLYSKINANGTISLPTACGSSNSFCSAGNFLAAINTLRNFGFGIANNYMYIIGGDNGSGGSTVNTVLYSKVKADGTLAIPTACGSGNQFCQAGTFNNARSMSQGTIYNGYVYLAGGQTTSSVGNCTTGTGTTWDCNDVQMSRILYNSFGVDGIWNYTHNSTNDGGSFLSGFTNARWGHTAIAYNGYIYIIGGYGSTSGDDCASVPSFGYCNGVQFAKINADGTIGTWQFTGNGNSCSSWVSPCNSGFSLARTNHTSAVYNGYIYVIGGRAGTNSKDCTVGSSSEFMCNGVQFAKINSDGTVGAWHYTHNSTDDGTTFVAGFTQAREGQNSVVYNGYLYVIGGGSPFGSYYNDVQFAKINSDGTVGAWHYTHNSTDDGTTFVAGFNNPRYFPSSAAYNGYLYVLGGQSNSSLNDCSALNADCNGVQFAVINANGTIGAWQYTANGSACSSWASPCNSGFTQARYQFASVASNGYLYVIGGALPSGSDVNDVQFAKINSDGTVGAWHYTHNSTDDGTTFVAGFTHPRDTFPAVVSSGNLYIIGGYSSSTAGDDCGTNCNGVQFVSLNSPAQTARYEKIVDIGAQNVITGISFNGRAVCGMEIKYSLGDSSGVFGTVNTIAYGLPGTTYAVNNGLSRYIWVRFKPDDSVCGTQSQITDFTVTYNQVPAAPTLSAPSNGATGVTSLVFQLRTTDADNDYLRYKLLICSTSNCSTVVATIDQTSSQSGWTGQDQQSSTAYTGNSVITSSTLASNTYAGAITKNTQYWWEAFAIDPGGSNNWSSASAIQTFTTGDASPSAPTLVQPVSSSSGNSVFTTFKLRSAEYNSDYLKYWIDVCADSSCTTIIRSICQTNTGTGVPDGGACSASQTGWSAQDQQSGTAYSGNPSAALSQLAVHSYQSPYLTKNTTYWWRAYAIDPGGSNTWSSSSAIQAFTTAPTETKLQGTINIKGNTLIY